MSTFGTVLAGCERLGEVPTGSSIMDLKERAAVAAAKAAQHAAAGHQALARSWNNAAQRLRRELQARLKTTSLGELAELGFGTPTKVIGGGMVFAGLAYGLYKVVKKTQKAAERAEET